MKIEKNKYFFVDNLVKRGRTGCWSLVKDQVVHKIQEKRTEIVHTGKSWRIRGIEKEIWGNFVNKIQFIHKLW